MRSERPGPVGSLGDGGSAGWFETCEEKGERCKESERRETRSREDRKGAMGQKGEREREVPGARGARRKGRGTVREAGWTVRAPAAARTAAEAPIERAALRPQPPPLPRRAPRLPPAPAALQLLGRLPQASKNWACPPSRPKTEPTASDRDTSVSSLGETYVSQARSWSHTPPCGEHGRRTWRRQPPLQGAEARLPITGGIDLRWAP